jgi:replicative superfamily II helicase
VAAAFKVKENFKYSQGEDVDHIKQFLSTEVGTDFPLVDLLDYGVAVHHAGLPDDIRGLVEWLTEEQKLRALVATTTIAQGVNLPVSVVVFASHQYPWGQDMPPEDFWNMAGRAGPGGPGRSGNCGNGGADAGKGGKTRRLH